MKGLGLGLGLSGDGGGAPSYTAWSPNANATITDQGGGWYKIEKTGGSNGVYTDCTVSTVQSLVGDFTFALQNPAQSGESIAGPDDAPSTYTTIDLCADMVGSTLFSQLSGFSSAQNHGAYGASDYIVWQRVGSTVSLYRTADLSSLGTALRTITNSSPLYGVTVFSAVGQYHLVRMG